MRSGKKNTDSQRLKISGQEFSLLIKAVVEKNVPVKFKVTGKSMFPSILSGDVLTLAPYDNRKPEIGDVIACSQNNQIIVHRIINEMNGRFLIKGDNVLKCDGFFPCNQIIGYVCAIERNKKKIPITLLKNQIYVILSKLRVFCLSSLFFLFRKI